MNENQKWEHIVSLDEELLIGGVVLSEWTTFLVKDADIAFVHGAYISSITLCLAAVESYIKNEEGLSGKHNLVDLINLTALEEGLAEELHEIRKFRNRWIHIADPKMMKIF